MPRNRERQPGTVAASPSPAGLARIRPFGFSARAKGYVLSARSSFSAETNWLQALKQVSLEPRANPAAELELLQRCSNSAMSKMLRVPTIEMLPENNVLQGILRHDDYLRAPAGDAERWLSELLPAPGGRLPCRHEVRGIGLGTVAPGQFADGCETRLRAITTKTKKARILPIYGEMKQWLEMARAERGTCPWVFQKQGERMVFNWRTWHSLCKLAGVPELLFHDPRRTALYQHDPRRHPRKSGDGDYRAPHAQGFRALPHRQRSGHTRGRIEDGKAPFGPRTGTISGTIGHSPESRLLN